MFYKGFSAEITTTTTLKNFHGVYKGLRNTQPMNLKN